MSKTFPEGSSFFASRFGSRFRTGLFSSSSSFWGGEEESYEFKNCFALIRMRERSAYIGWRASLRYYADSKFREIKSPSAYIVFLIRCKIGSVSSLSRFGITPSVQGEFQVYLLIKYEYLLQIPLFQGLLRPKLPDHMFSGCTTVGSFRHFIIILSVP